MTQISTDASLIIGTSDCGRIIHRDVDDGPQIDGRRAWRGLYVGPDGLADQTAPVPAADWAAAVAVMAAVGAERERRNEASREVTLRRLDERDAHLDGIERIKGGAYDHNTF